VNAPQNKTALLIVADDPLIADTLGDFPGRGYIVITTSEPPKTILRMLAGWTMTTRASAA
jgi:hypothetical protein